LIIASAIFLTEVINNYILYATRSQGYGPDTIVSKLLRYLVITTIVNFGCVIYSRIYNKKSVNLESKKYTIMTCTIIICTNVAFSHYQFASTLCIFVVPIVLSILFEDRGLNVYVFILSLIGLFIAVIARALDPLYNKDIVPEAMITFMLAICMYIFAKIIIAALQRRREEVGNALLEAEHSKIKEDQNKLSLNMLETLARALDAKDKYTNGHAARVSLYSVLLATEMGLPEEEINNIRIEALLHDIGKIGIPDAVLNKPDKLTNMEFSVIKSHSQMGANILKDLPIYPMASDVAKYHHERYDGKGYPTGISGDEIPLHAKICCIADCYDAMSSDRIYRKALPREVIREELVNNRGTQFDPECLDAFIKLFDEGKLSSARAASLSEESKTANAITSDIENVMYHINRQDGINDFKKFYIYMRNIGLRYNRTVEVVSINIDLDNNKNNSDAELAMIRKDLRVAINKNIRSVDMLFEYSDTQDLIIFLDAGLENIDLIVNRIYFDFYANYDSNSIKLSHKINENMELDEK